jgi:hypothetical protein
MTDKRDAIGLNWTKFLVVGGLLVASATPVSAQTIDVTYEKDYSGDFTISFVNPLCPWRWAGDRHWFDPCHDPTPGRWHRRH